MPPDNEDLELDLENDLDNEGDDLDHEGDGKGGEKEPKDEVKLGDQEDGSVVVELDEEADAGTGTPTGEADTAKEEEEEAERERIREARRQERAERKARAKERDERMRRELQAERERNAALEERIAAIERRSTGAEMAQLESTETQTKKAYNYFKDQIRIGTEANDGKLVAEATEKMLLAQQRLNQITHIKQNMTQQRNAPPPLDERLVNHANSFMTKHTWYRPDGQDDDSTICRAIDNKLAAEGWDPRTDAYWSELENRLKKYLPHRAKGATVQPSDDKGGERRATGSQQSQGKPKSVVTGSGRESSQTSGGAAKGTFRLSPERVSAMKEAGMWDDPVLRKKQIEYYRKYDKENGGK